MKWIKIVEVKSVDSDTPIYYTVEAFVEWVNDFRNFHTTPRIGSHTIETSENREETVMDILNDYSGNLIGYKPLFKFDDKEYSWFSIRYVNVCTAIFVDDCKEEREEE